MDLSKRIDDKEEYEIRYSNPDDLPELEAWMKAEPFWYPVSSEQDIMGMARNWIGFSRFSSSLTAIYKGEKVGIATLFLMPYRKLIHHALVYFIVNPAFTGRGVGTSLVKNVMHLGDTYFHFERLCFETYLGCPALSILIKAGWEETVRQEHFSKDSHGKYSTRVVFEYEVKSGK